MGVKRLSYSANNNSYKLFPHIISLYDIEYVYDGSRLKNKLADKLYNYYRVTNMDIY